MQLHECPDLTVLGVRRRWDGPGAGVLEQSDMRIVRLRFGGGEQDQGRVRTGCLVRPCDELFADPLFLELGIDG